MLNTQMLNKKIEDSGLNCTFITNKLGISRESFYKKKRGEVKFKLEEIDILSDLLRLTPSEVREIFFNDEVG